jgi:folate-binding protein YgfZ
MTENATPNAAPVVHASSDTPPAAFRPTRLTSQMATDTNGPECCAYRGTVTTKGLDAPEREIEALLSGVAVHDLGWLRRVAVRGDDRFRWLSGMVTNTVTDLGTNAGAWNLVLNAQGRIQGDLHVWREGDALTLEIAADQYDRLLAHLNRFIIMDDVDLVPLSLDQNEDVHGETALGLTGPKAADLLTQLDLPELNDPLTSTRAVWNGTEMRVIRAYGTLAPHYELWVQADRIPALWQALIEAGAIAVGADSLEALRIAEGIPAYGIDIAERDLPQETSQMRALHFSKGCYLGQEIVERIRSRGNVHRHLRPLELTGAVPQAGTELTVEGGATAGQITSAAGLPFEAGKRIFALGMIRGEAELRDQLFKYSASGAAGTAHILATQPEFESNQRVMQSAKPTGN